MHKDVYFIPAAEREAYSYKFQLHFPAKYAEPRHIFTPLFALLVLKFNGNLRTASMI